MKRFASHGLIVLGVIIALGLSTPAIAFAKSRPAATSQKAFHQEVAAYQASRDAIQFTFRFAVNSAKKDYRNTLAQTSSSAQRSAARQAMETAIIHAAASRSAALIALGKPPVKFS